MILPPRGKPSLIDIFHALRFRHFPSPQLNFTVYFALYDGVGEGIMELTISQLQTEEDIVVLKENVVLPGRGMHRNCPISVNNFSFPAPGNYSITLRFRGENEDTSNELAFRLLEVFHE